MGDYGVEVASPRRGRLILLEFCSRRITMVLHASLLTVCTSE
jgi:hypothetical protein